MRVVSKLPGLSSAQARRVLAGLPPTSYAVVVKPLRYRREPHLAAYTEFEERGITLQVPTPFLPFGAVVHHAARRVAAKGLRFVWLSEGVTFSTPREVLRFLYLHEWMHWYLKEKLGRKSAAETACDRFALQNYLRAKVTAADAETALRRAASVASIRVADRKWPRSGPPTVRRINGPVRGRGRRGSAVPARRA